MSSTYYNLASTERTKFGSKESKNDRKSGLIPAVIYYSGEENITPGVVTSIRTSCRLFVSRVSST